MTTHPALWTSIEAAVITGGRCSASWQATGVSLNIQDIQPGDLFFAGKDDNLNEVFLRGAAAAVVSGGCGDGGENWPLLHVGDVFEALRGMARAARFKTHAQVIAVQGSPARLELVRMLSSSFSVYQGKRHLSLGLAGLPETADFAIFGFSPMIRPDVAIVTDCKTADGSVFETMAPTARILINTDSTNVADVIALARAAGLRNIFTYGHSADADSRLLDSLEAANGTRMRINVLAEDIEIHLAPGENAGLEILAAALMLKLSDTPRARIANILSTAHPQIANHGNNLTLMNRLFGSPSQAAFRVVNTIDRGNNRRTIILDNVSVTPQKTSIFSNKELDIPLKIDNLELVYACKEVSLFSNAEAAIQQVRPAAALGRIVPCVLGPGDFLTFKNLVGNSKSMISNAMRLMPHGKKIKADHAV